MLEQVASIDEDKRGLYIREHGLYQSDIDTWKTEVLCVAEQVQQVLKDAENRHQEELVDRVHIIGVNLKNWATPQ